MFRLFITVMVLLNLQHTTDLYAQSPSPRGELRILWYNVENLFHPTDDTIPGDDEFTPEGVRHWTIYRYRKKVTSIAKVIVAAGQWDPPDLVGMCEIEGAAVLEDLVRHPILEPYGYRFIHRDGPDRRGMDVACLYREKRITLAGWNTYAPPVAPGMRPTRDILHVWMSVGAKDTMDLFLVHLISKYSGAGATAEARKNQARGLVRLADSIRNRRPHGLIILAGDFNEEYAGYSLEPVRTSLVGNDSIRKIGLSGGEGTYRYRGTWSHIDQFMITGQAQRYRVSGSILALQALIIPDGSYGGMKPARTYEGFQYRGGVSDHLPILLDITRRPFSIRAER